MNKQVNRLLKNSLLKMYLNYYYHRLSDKKFNFLIIGAQKCGTSALFEYLNI